MSYYGLCGKMLAAEGRRKELLQIMLQAAELLEANPDCHHYVVSRVRDEADAIWITEVWTDEGAHDASLEPEEVRAFISQARPLIAGFGEQIHLETLGGKGL